MSKRRTAELTDFHKTVWRYFTAHQRAMPWRLPELDGSFDPYKILVSEIMLQQTQVPRVIPKFEAFLQTFPTLESLSSARLSQVLTVWNGLGYNRRAKFLWQAAQQLTTKFNGHFPADQAALQTLPGVGVHTAGAILVYAFNQPALFIETNIRTVFIHHFFAGQASVTDNDIRPLLEQSLQGQPPREFYWALMDYGAHLKATIGNSSRLSTTYARQPVFKGSQRQIRGQVVRLLTGRAYLQDELSEIIADDRLQPVLAALEKEGLVQKVVDIYQLV